MRVQVNLSDEMVSRIDEYCRIMGVSRSSFCAVCIGQHVMNLDRSQEILSSVGTDIVSGVQSLLNQ